MSVPVCDFCSSSHVVCWYPCPDFETITLEDETGHKTHVKSAGEWAACADCAKLIEAYDIDTLVTRALKKFYEQVFLPVCGKS